MRLQQFDRLRILAAAVAVCGLAAIPAPAQEEATQDKVEAKSQRTVIKATAYIDVGEAEAVLDLLDVNYALKPDQNLIVLRGEAYAVDTALKVIDALDEPRPSIDLHVSVLSASRQGETDVPEEFKSVVGQLRNIFGYSGFTLLDNITLRVLEGGAARADGAIRLGDDTERTGYHFGFRKITVVPEDDSQDDSLNIRIRGLKFDVNGQVAGTLRASLMTDVQIREGQKAVIGSSTPQGAGETLILIVEATASPNPPWKNE